MIIRLPFQVINAVIGYGYFFLIDFGLLFQLVHSVYYVVMQGDFCFKLFQAIDYQLLTFGSLTLRGFPAGICDDALTEYSACRRYQAYNDFTVHALPHINFVSSK
jgi:hypothetical protein